MSQPFQRDLEIFKLTLISEELRTRFFTAFGILLSVLVGLIILVLSEYSYFTSGVLFPNFTVFLVVVLSFVIVSVTTVVRIRAY